MKELNKTWNAFDIARGSMELEEVRNVIALGMVHIYSEKSGDFDVPQEATLEMIIKQGASIVSAWRDSLYEIEGRNPILQGITEALYPEKIQERILMALLMELSQLDITNDKYGLLFEEVLLKLEASLGKGGNKFSTPTSINELCIKILNPTYGDFYNGCAGMNGMLVEAKKYSNEQLGELNLYGEEINREAWALGKINLILHGMYETMVERADVLVNPKFITEKKFDFVMMDPPFALKLDTEIYENLRGDKHGRFNYGIPPKSSADMAFVLHALSSLKQTGRAIVVLSSGALFRGGPERTIRENLLKADVIEAVITLPSRLYTSTMMPVNLLVLNRNKSEERKGKVLFIDAQEEFKELNRKTRVLGSENIENISNMLHNAKEVDNISKYVDVKEIRGGDLTYASYLKPTDYTIESFGTVCFDYQKFEKAATPKKMLKNVVNLYRGINISPRELESGKGEYKIIRLADVQDGELQLHQLESCNILNNARTSSYLVQEGDIIISSRGSNIKIAVIPAYEGNILLSQNFIGIRPGQQLNPFYLKTYLESPVGQFLLTSKQVGGSIATLTPKNIEDILIPLVSLEEQSLISDKAQKAAIAYQQAIQKAENEKKQAMNDVYKQMGLEGVYTIR
ncbi:N-6 DNA methylase [Bacillus wiedmannii]|uniref:N-6 DNA methylase n=1 Tax=Bacillus wiedmannii TaxID=1890302 RepID=UPI000BFDC448|nr:N-6 DNA methylase [Bacillus wiedmannii]PHG81182.1 N-6 DNA methylase [Bacillus wiedmannii]